MPKEMKIRTERMDAPTSSDIFAGVPGSELFPPFALFVGDKIEKEGFVDLLRVNELGYSPEVPQDEFAYGNRILELRTYCLVRISSKVDASHAVEEFRILYADHKGEQLATSMAVLAALKDAFVHRKKVRVHGEVSQLEIHVMVRVFKSAIYYALQSVDLIRS